MATKAPSVAQIAVAVTFALSCIGLLIYLWIAFGGPAPLKPQGYEIRIPFQEATTLTQQTDVRISGVSVGKVQKIELSEDKRQAMATIELDAAHAPLPADTRAVIRAKTLLGEAYVELSPGNGAGPMLAEGATLPAAQVLPTVKLDEILRSFDEPTRAAFRVWMQEAAVAINGRGEDFGNAIGEFQPTFTAFDDVFRTLDTQDQAVSQLFANGEVTFDALRGRSGELAGLITEGNRVFKVTGERNREIEETFRAFPTFLDESKATVERLQRFSADTDPLMRQLIPAGREFSPTFEEIGRLSPGFRRFFTGLGPVAKSGPSGLSNFRALLRDDFPPLLVELDPFLRSLIPVVKTIGEYEAEVTSVFANAAAATNGILPGASGSQPHYLRTLASLSPESLASFPNRLKSNRNTAYTPAGGYKIPGLQNFIASQCTGGITALLDPNTPNDPNFNARVDGDVADAQVMFDRLMLYAFGDGLNSDDVPAPGCGQQAPLAPIGGPGPSTTFQHVTQQPRGPQAP